MVELPLRAACTTILLASCISSDCGNQILQDVASPDGRRHAVVFNVDCGATTGFSTRVSLLTKGRTVDNGGNVFVVDSDHGNAPAGPGGGPSVTVRWLDKRTLEVRYDGRARIFAREIRHDDTDIRYVADTTSSTRDTVSPHSPTARLDSTDFIVVGLTQGSDSAAVFARLGQPDSVSLEDNPYDPGMKLPTWHYRAMNVNFIAEVQSFEIIGPAIPTARGVRVGDTLERLKAVYGEPSNRYDDDWSYTDPKQDLHQITFTVRSGRIVKVFIGTGLD